MSALKDLTGQRFGRLVVIKRAGSDKHGLTTWACQCDCGKVKVISRSNLLSGRVNSCGCLSNELARKRCKTHGKRNSRLYKVWAGMKERCHNPKHNRYNRYGGRGITVCDEWLHDFQAFYEWAMANGYDENAAHGQCTIDRIDNDKGYSSDNCRWVDMKTQRHNRSDSRKEK